MPADVWSLYGWMLKSRRFEEATARVWQDGLISGEMHLGTGEEAVIAGVLAHLREGDAMALDHRGSAALLMRGVDPALLFREMLGRSNGLCHGMGGHMHLFSKEHLAATSGIVGAGGPAAAGFALAAQYLNPGAVAVAFFGEGAMNQGMLMEALNLAAAWQLPVVFVCKDDGWAITTPAHPLTAGNLGERARGLGVPAVEVDGRDLTAVWEAAGRAIQTARAGQGPTFLQARCVHLEAHFLGYQLLRIVRAPFKELPAISIPLVRSFFAPGGAALRERVAGLKMILDTVSATARDPRQDPANDPLALTRKELSADPGRLEALETQVGNEIQQVFAAVLAEVQL
jgi:acetoin:2,6-dichlorophenolindophenol oxidoreductase subunit alpha